MGIFDNMSYGLSPEFASSPQTVQMDFFTDLSPLAGMISAKSATTSTKKPSSVKGGKMLFNQQLESDRYSKVLEDTKTKMSAYFMNKAKQMVTENPDMSLSKAITTLAPEIENAASSIVDKEYQHRAYVGLHERNLVEAEKDRADEEKSKQYTLLSLGEKGGEVFVGYDKNGNITYNQDEIVSLMTNDNWYNIAEKNLAYGNTYISPIKIDTKAGDQYIRDIFEKSKSSLSSKSWEQDYTPSEKQQIGYINLYGKLAKMTNGGERTNNFEALVKDIDYFKRFIPTETERAIKSEYLRKRTDKSQWSYIRTVPKKEKDKKGNDIIVEKQEAIRLKDMSFDEGYNIYLADQLATVAGASKFVKVEDKNTFELTEKGDYFGGIGTDKQEYTTSWERFVKGSNVGADKKIFNVKGTDEGAIGVEAAIGDQFNNIMDTIFKNAKAKYPNLSDDKIKEIYLNEKEQKRVMKAITNKMPKTEDALNAETFGNLVVEVQGKKISNSNTGDPLDSWSSESAGDNNLAVFTTVPSTKNQFFTNYGSVVKEYNNLANVGNAGVGGRIIGDLYGEGMVLIPKTVAQNSFVLYTKSGYKGVERLNSNGQLTNGDIVRQKIAVRKDDLEKLKFSYKLNGKWQDNLNGEMDNVQSTIGIRELTKNELEILKDQAVKNKNTEGATKIQLAIDGKETYYEVDRLYQDVTNQALDYAYQEIQQKVQFKENLEDASNYNNFFIPPSNQIPTQKKGN